MEGEVQINETANVPDAVVAQSDIIQDNVAQENVPRGTTETNGHEGKPEGFDAVELTPAQQARFDRIYGNMKRYEGDAKELREINQQLIRTVEQLHVGQTQIVSHLQTSDFKEAEAKLMSDRDAAWQRGDMNAYNSASDKINEIKIQKTLTERERAAQQVKQPIQPRGGVNGEQLANAAVHHGDLSPVEANIAKSWMSETDTGGNLKRPWTQPDNPRNQAAALQAQAVFTDPEYAAKPVAEKLREIDRRMGLQTTQSTQGQNVLGAGNLTRGNRNNNINSVKLDPSIEKIAIRTKFGGPDAKTDQDHVDAWKKAVLKSSVKGAKK